MRVGDARGVGRQWVMEHVGTPGLCGALYHGSTVRLPDDAPFSAMSDVDLLLLCADPDPPDKPGKVRYRGVLLDISYLPGGWPRSPEVIAGQYHLAGTFHPSSIILDPSGELRTLCAAVSALYGTRRWVRARCEHARDRILKNLDGWDETAPFHDQVVPWLFATGVTTHVLLVAGLRNPTVRRRYVAARALLADHGRPELYDTLLEMLGCADIDRARVEGHLAALAEAFDAAAAVARTPFPFASDISEVARPLAIDGTRALIEAGLHREAIFWLVATYSRCQKVLAHDGPAAMLERFSPGYRHLLGDLGIASFADLLRRGEQVRAFLPRLQTEAEAIIATNPGIHDERNTSVSGH